MAIDRGDAAVQRVSAHEGRAQRGGECGRVTARIPRHGDQERGHRERGTGAYAAACAALTVKVLRLAPRKRYRHDSCVPSALARVSVRSILAVPRISTCDRRFARPNQRADPDHFARPATSPAPENETSTRCLHAQPQRTGTRPTTHTRCNQQSTPRAADARLPPPAVNRGKVWTTPDRAGSPW